MPALTIAASRFVPAMRRKQPAAVTASTLPFLCLLGFVATQGYLIPVMALPVNWVLWPSLPDIFAFAMVLSSLFLVGRTQMHSFNRTTVLALMVMLVLFIFNLIVVTLPNSRTGEGIKYGGFSIFLLAKFIIVYWAATLVPITPRRKHLLHLAAWAAFLWLALTVLLTHFSLFDPKSFVTHLPMSSAGKWSAPFLKSTVSNSHGVTSVTLLILAGLIATTTDDRAKWLTYSLILTLGLAATFLTGSRQGVVRFLVFVIVLFVKEWRTLLLVVVCGAVLVATSLFFVNSDDAQTAEKTKAIMERQGVLVEDPFSNEGLSGRPKLWLSVLGTLGEEPIRYLTGYGLGNYVEYRNSAHNMVLQMLQDGGVTGLLVMMSCYVAIFRSLWRFRRMVWPVVATTAGMLTSFFTSSIFYPDLSTGWYLGFYFVCLHFAVSGHHAEWPISVSARGHAIRRQTRRGGLKRPPRGESLRAPLEATHSRVLNQPQP